MALLYLRRDWIAAHAVHGGSDLMGACQQCSFTEGHRPQQSSGQRLGCGGWSEITVTILRPALIRSVQKLYILCVN